MIDHNLYMQRCLQLASNGLGTTYPNPLVGSVIVDDDGSILGEGWHYQSGKPHAEVIAVNNALQRGCNDYAFAKATLYVNLEPCSHTGKTPPCATMIVNKGFKKVVIGTLDPHSKVAGKGVEMLQQHGIEVVIGVLSDQCNRLNKRFFTYHQQQRPYIILKWAQTQDGFIAPNHKLHQSPVWITSQLTRQYTHQLRAQEHAILVGAQTIIDDNPSLTCRDWFGESPIRLGIDTRDTITNDYAIMDHQASCYMINTTNPNKIINQLYDLNIQSVIIEGGSRTIQSFIDHNLWDQAIQMIGSQMYFENGTKAPVLPQDAVCESTTTINQDVINSYIM